MTPVLQVKNISYIYSQGTPFEHQALTDVSFSVSAGECIGIIGHTGSGKSTLLQQMNGLLKPSAGQVMLAGADIWKDKQSVRNARFQVGLVFQYPEYQLFEETVYQDIAFGPQNMGLDKAEIDRRVHEAAGFVGLNESQLRSSPFDLSGGQKRRVAIAGVIAMEPKVLILDEPAAGLDPMGKKGILENIRYYQQEKHAAVIMVSHSMEDIAKMSDRILVLSKSRLMMDGTPEEIFSKSEELVQMGLDVPEITKIFLKLREMGLQVSNVYSNEQAIAILKNLKRSGSLA